MGMRLTEEQALQDNMRFANCNTLAELKYCGWNIPHRKSITNDEIRFYAWLCRSAVSMLKEQEAVEPRVSTAEQRCGHCNKVIEMDGWKACPWCGKPILWEAVGRSVK